MDDITAALDVSAFLAAFANLAPSLVLIAAVGWLLGVVHSFWTDEALRTPNDDDDDDDEEEED